MIKLRILICDDDEKVLNSLKVMTEDILNQIILYKDIQIETFSTTYDLMDFVHAFLNIRKEFLR